MLREKDRQLSVAELLLGCVHLLGDSVRVEQNPIALMERDFHCRIGRVREEAEEEAVFQKGTRLPRGMMLEEQRRMPGPGVAKRPPLGVDECIRRRHVMLLKRSA